jgi:hypothetical protein
MALPDQHNADTVDLNTVATWAACDLENPLTAELRTLINRIRACAFRLSSPQKYRNNNATLGSTDNHRIQCIVNPPSPRQEDDASQDRRTQSQLVRQARAFSTTEPTPNLPTGWRQRAGTDGTSITDFEFHNQAIVTVANELGFPGANPYTLTKADSLKGIGQVLWDQDIYIESLANGFHRFCSGLYNAFIELTSVARTSVRAPELPSYHVLRSYNPLSNSTAEGVYLSVLFDQAARVIFQQMGTSPPSSYHLCGSNKRAFGGVRSELDGLLIWRDANITRLCIIEAKGKVDADISLHQILTPAQGIRQQIANPDIVISMLYVRCEHGRNDDTWVARCDYFNEEADLISSFDISNIARLVP